MPRLRQSLFARTRLGRRSRQGNPMLLSDVTQMLRRIASGGDELRNESGLAHSQVLFEALEPRILLSADGLMPPPSPDMFDDNPEPEEVVLPPSELDEEVADKLPEEEVDTLDPGASDDGSGGEEENDVKGEQDESDGAEDDPDQQQDQTSAQDEDAEGPFVESIRALDGEEPESGTYSISFGEDYSYQVFDADGEEITSGVFDPDNPVIQFGGVELTIGGDPVAETSLEVSWPAEDGAGESESTGAAENEQTDSETSGQEDAAVAETDSSADGDEDEETRAAAPAEQTDSEEEGDRSTQIVFVDSAVKDYKSLIDQIAGETSEEVSEPEGEEDEDQQATTATASDAQTGSDGDADPLQSEPLADDAGDEEMESFTGTDAELSSRPTPSRSLSTSDSDIHVYVLDSNEDGVDQISRVLDGYDGVEAVHILSHGSAGALALGNTRLNANNLKEVEQELEGWGESLAEGGDIQLYGCDVADGEQGAKFIQDFSELTGADVAASVNDTGAADLGADWTLEYTTGVVESTVINDSLAASSYAFLLDSPTITNNGTANVEVSGSGNADHWRITDSGTTLTISNTGADSATFNEVLNVSSGGTLTIDLGGGADTLTVDSALSFDFKLVVVSDLIDVSDNINANGNDIELHAVASETISSATGTAEAAAEINVTGAALSGGDVKLISNATVTGDVDTGSNIDWDITSKALISLTGGASINATGEAVVEASTGDPDDDPDTREAVDVSGGALVDMAITDTARVTITDSSISGDSVSVTATADGIYTAQGTVITQVVDGDVSVDLSGATLNAAGGSLTVEATDNITVVSETRDLEINLADVTGNTLSLEVHRAFNDVDRDVRTAVAGDSDLDAEGDIDVKAGRAASIFAQTGFTTLAGDATTSLSVEGGGTFAHNSITGGVEAYVEGSTVDAGSGGNVTVKASDDARIDADAWGGAAVDIGEEDTNLTGIFGGSAGAGALGLSVAMNSIGWATSDLMEQFAEAEDLLEILIGNAGIGGEDASDIRAYISDSTVTAAGAVAVTAASTAQINSTVSNAVKSTSSTLFKGNSGSLGGLFSGNKVNSDVQAFMGEKLAFDYSADEGTRVVQAGDRVKLDSGEVYEYSGGGGELDLSESAQNYGGNGDWTLLQLDGDPTTVTAGNGSAQVAASDESSITANSRMVSSSVTTNDGGASLADGLVGYLVEGVGYVTNGEQLSTDATSTDEEVADSTEATSVNLNYGDRVRLTGDFAPTDSSDTSAGTAGGVYEFLGADGTGIDFADEDFTDLDRWKEIQETQLIPTGNNLTDSNSVSVGVTAVYNDIRGEVQSSVEDADVTATDGAIKVTADDKGVLDATADSSATSSGGSAFGEGTSLAINGTVAVNALQGAASAFVKNSSLVTNGNPADDEVDIVVAAENSAELTANTLQATTTGDTAGSFLVAFNTVGWDSPSLFTQAFDVLIGNRIGTETGSEATAYIEDSNIDSAGDVTVRAVSSSTIEAEISNNSTAAASALIGASASNYAGILASNAVSGGASAWIDNSDVTSGEVINAAGGVTVLADDTSRIDSQTLLEAPTSSSNDLGAGILNDLATTLLDDYRYSTESGSQTLEFGDRVRIASTFGGGVEEGAVYQYMGTGETVDLSDDTAVDYSDKTLWKLLNETNVIPGAIATAALKATGIEGAAGGADALGGLVARNDVRSEVAASIIQAVVTAEDGDIRVLASEAARILAKDKSVLTAVGSNKAGVIVNNLVLANADAKVVGSTLNAYDAAVDDDEFGNIEVAGHNEALIDAEASGSVSGGDILGFTVAFNTLGWKAQDLFTQTLDAVIGAPYLAQIGAPDHVIDAGSDISGDGFDSINLEYGQSIRIDDPSKLTTGNAVAGTTYLWQGDDDETLNLATEDFTDTSRWREVLAEDVFGGVDASGATAHIQDSEVIAEGDLDVSAISEAGLASDVSSASISEKVNNAAIRAAWGVNSQAAGGIIAGNKVASEARAWINNDGIVGSTDDAIDVGGDLAVRAWDTAGDNDLALEPAYKLSETDDSFSTVAPRGEGDDPLDVVWVDDTSVFTVGAGEEGYYRFIGDGQENIVLKEENFLDESRWERLRPAGIESKIELEVVSSATNDITALKELANNLGLDDYEYTTKSGTKTLNPGAAGSLATGSGVDPYSAEDGFAPRIAGDRVWMSVSDFLSGLTQGEQDALNDQTALQDGVYEYVGDAGVDVDLAKTDYSDENLWKRLDQRDFEDILFPELGNLSESNSTAVGGMVVMNDVRGEVEAYIDESEVVADGDIEVEAVEDAAIRAYMNSNVSSSGGSALGEGTSLARQGQIVTNLVMSSADAFIRDSVVETTGSADGSLGDLTVRAENAALIDSTLHASTQTGDEAEAVTLAFNSIGWKPQNVLFNAVDALLGDPLISEAFELENPARTHAFILNSDVDVAGNLTLDAQGNTQVNATVSNATVSAASALKGAEGKAYGGILASNKVSTDVKAYIDWGTVNFTDADGLQTVRYGDRVESGGDVYEYTGDTDTLDLDDSAQEYATNNRWVLIDNPGHGYQTDIDAGGGVAVNAEDNAGVYSNIKLVLDSTTTNDGGASAFQETISDVVPVDYDSGNALYTSPIALAYGDRVRVADDHTAGGEPGSVYRYLGPGAGETVNLSGENYANLDLWKLEPESDVVPDDINISDSNPAAWWSPTTCAAGSRRSSPTPRWTPWAATWTSTRWRTPPSAPPPTAPPPPAAAARWTAARVNPRPSAAPSPPM